MRASSDVRIFMRTLRAMAEANSTAAKSLTIRTDEGVAELHPLER